PGKRRKRNQIMTRKPARPMMTSRLCPPRAPGRLYDRDGVAHDGAEILAHVVVARFARLHAAYLVGGAGHQPMSAFLARIPAVRPTDPHEAVAWCFQVGGVPRIATIHADLHLIDGAGTTPGVARDHVNSRWQSLGVVVGLGDDGFHTDRGD